MKKILTGLGLIVSLSNYADANVKALANSWQMLGTSMDMDLEKRVYPEKDDFSIIWHYKDGKWGAFSKDENIVQDINNSHLYNPYIKAGEAFWIKTKDNNVSFLPYSPEVEFAPHTRGWHLISFANGLKNLDSLLNNGVKSFFVYRDNGWEYINKDSNGNFSGNLKSIDKHEGFWIYMDSNSSNPYYNMNDLDSDSSNEESFSNKKFIFSNGINIVLDQNGTVLSNDSNISGGEWKGLYFDNGYNKNISFRVKKNDTLYTYEFNSNNYNHQKIDLHAKIITKMKYYNNGVKSIVESRVKDYFGDNTLEVTIGDYNKTKIVSDTITYAMHSIVQSLKYGGDLAYNKLESDKTTLSNAGENNDAKVALAIINLLETLNDPLVSNILTVSASEGANPSNLNLDVFLKVFVPNDDSVVKLADIFSNSPEADTTDLLQKLSDRLVSSANKLIGVYSDENYYFDYEDIKFNYVDVEALRVAMLGVSADLQYLASYQLGNREWLKINKENNIEYSKASYDPVGFLNSKTFFVNPNQSKLTSAKNILIEFLSGYKHMLEQKYHAKEGLDIKKSDLTTRNLYRKIVLTLRNLKDESTFALLRDDTVQWQQKQICDANGHCWNESIPKDVKEIYKFDFRKLFDINSALTINDFPSFKYENGILDVDKSKIENSPINSNGNELNVIFDSNNIPVNSHIKDAYLLHIDENNNVYQGNDLLNEIFGDSNI